MATDLLITIDSEGPQPGRLRAGVGLPARVDPARVSAFMASEDARAYSRVIVIGDGEALEQHGFGVVVAARAAGLEHVRLHTSSRRLTEARQVRAVVMAGVSEFGLGLHGDTAALHDELVGQPGDFAKLMTCFDRLAQHDVRVLVDVVLTDSNLEALPRIIALAHEKSVEQVTLWPLALGIEEPPCACGPVTLEALLPALHAAAQQCEALGVELRLRHVPMCLLGALADKLDHARADAFDGVRPGRPLPEFNCLLEAKCEHAEACLGLSHTYAAAHGWELERLVPTPRVRPWVERDRSVERSTGGVAGPRGHAAWLALLGEHADKVENVALTRQEARYPMQMPDGTRFVLAITARDPNARTFQHSRSFNIAYTDVEWPANVDRKQHELAIAAYLEPILATIVTNDNRSDASLSLDPKG